MLTSTEEVRPSSRARDESYYRNHIAPCFGDLQLASIDHLTVREWIAELNDLGLAPATVRKAHQVLSKMLRAAVDAGLIASSPCERQPLSKLENHEMRFLAPVEAAELADAIDRRYRSLVLVGAYGGLRAGELFGLRRDRVDLMTGRIDVAEIAVEVRGRHYFGPPKTQAGRRNVPLPRFVVDELTQHAGSLGPNQFVFPAPEGGPVRGSLFRRRYWLPAVEAAGVGPLRLHDLRHTAVAFWIAAGATPKEIAVRAGHSSVAVVLDRYVTCCRASRSASPRRLTGWRENPKQPPARAAVWCPWLRNCPPRPCRRTKRTGSKRPGLTLEPCSRRGTSGQRLGSRTQALRSPPPAQTRRLCPRRCGRSIRSALGSHGAGTSDLSGSPCHRL